MALELSPYIDPTLLELLKHRPYRLEEFSNVLLREIIAVDLEFHTPDGFTIRMAEPHEYPLFTQTVAHQFATQYGSAPGSAPATREPN